MSATALPAPIVHEQTEEKQKVCPNYHVIFLNDDYHSMEFVVAILQMIFKKEIEEAVKLMFTVHNEGQAIVVTCSKERAELYLEQVKAVPEGSKGPIGCVMEPAE